VSLDEFIRICQENGYGIWSISREQEKGEDGRYLWSYNVSIQGIFSISATEHTLEDAILTVMSVVEAVHGIEDAHLITGSIRQTHTRSGHPIRPRGGVS
jgi:hypothetical protein